ncbi:MULTISPECIES: response regulator [Methylosinus]|uniref:histidine kinase n=1 Tax=Methylosinus trichosporium (strain ATCC 35070 / NCIMB 11131 / UNIQEM 75 / OB3b) TaxID=595536 RepID=A0A2D2D3V3_METT3|nr:MULTISPECIES: response regulator [Methylosinus]ATQ69539.1 histidine kinase [Methylosinus trichosporium OB3b]OBS50500.1 histidine kinase [Methylosinus sp. 3S-1]
MRNSFIDISAPIYLGFVVLAASLFAAFAFVGKQSSEYRGVRQLISERRMQRELLVSLHAAESGQRGFLLTGDRSYLEPYEKARAEIDGDFASLASSMGGENERERLAEVRRWAEDALGELKKSLDLAAEGRRDEAVAIISDGHGKALMEKIHASLEALVARQQKLIDDQSLHIERSGGLLRVGAAVALAMTMLVGGAGIALLRSQLRALAAAQDELRSANEALSAEAAQRETLAEQLRQSQKMEAIGQLTGGLAHDFNNMLAVVIGSVNLAKRRLAGVDQPDAMRYLDSALEGAEHAATLTHRLLAFSRRQPLAPEPIDPNKMVSAMAEMLRRTLGEPVRLEAVFAGGLWRAFVDPSQLEMTILNLALNARDAMSEGGKLTIETSNAYLDEEYAAREVGIPPGQYVLVAVTDTGAGMSREVIERAFDPFFTTKPAGRGTGLGLSQVYGFVRQSGGHVKIYSEAGHGTTVKIYLPRHHGAAEAADAPAPARATPRGEKQETILVVEDDARVRALTADTLKELGYSVLEADGAAAALRQLDMNRNVDLLFTDVVMPGANGRHLADEARRRRPQLQILFTTGYTRNAVVHNGVLDPGVELIVKPYSIDRLARKVRDLLDRREPGVEATGPGLKILVVDDDIAVGEAMAELLRLDGHETRIATSGEEAIALAQSFRPELALLDLSLPGMNGYDVARAIRASPDGREIVLVASTGSGGETVRLRCEAAGFDHHLVKPTELDALKRLIDARRLRPSRPA